MATPLRALRQRVLSPSETHTSAHTAPQCHVLYHQHVPVRVTRAERDARLPPQEHDAVLTFQVSLVDPSPTRRAHGEQVLHFELTQDDEDPFFYYTLDVSENEFHALRREQSLRVDFARFPQSFTQLVEAARAGGEESAGSSGSEPESPSHVRARREATAPALEDEMSVGGGSNDFSCSLHIEASGAATFAVVETNEFKHLQHIALQFVAGDDAAVKQFLARRLDELKTALAETSEELSNCESTLHSTVTERRQLEAELQTAQRTEVEVVSSLRVEHSNELSRVKSETAAAMRELQVQLEEQMRQAQEDWQQQEANLRLRVEELQQQTRDLTENKYSVEGKLQETTRALETANAELEHAKREIERYRQRHEEHGAGKMELDRELQRLRVRVATLEQEVRDKDVLLERQQELLASTREQKESGDEAIALYRRNLERGEARVQELGQEVAKGNEIIQHLQMQLRSFKDKMRRKATVIIEQENLLERTREQNETAQRELSDTTRQLATQQSENAALKSALERTREQLEQSQKQLESNSKMIDWLNKELTGARTGGIVDSTLADMSGDSMLASAASPFRTSRASASASLRSRIPVPGRKAMSSEELLASVRTKPRYSLNALSPEDRAAGAPSFASSAASSIQSAYFPSS